MKSINKMNITTVMAIISSTVIFTGGTTKMVLDLLNKWFPKDKIYRNPEDLDENSSFEEDHSVDFGYDDYLEEPDHKVVLEGFLIKNQTMEHVDPFGERFLEEADVIFLSFIIFPNY